MSKAAGNMKRGILWIFSGVLSMLGVLSAGCSNVAEPSYGPPSTSLVLFGTTRSSADSTLVPGIEVSALDADSSTVITSTLTDSQGVYLLYLDSIEFPWPDTLLVTVTDIDGTENGSFLNADTLVFPEVENPYIDMETNFYLQPDVSE